MHQAFLARHELHEGPEIHDSPHGSGVPAAHLGLLHQAFDQLVGLVGPGLVAAVDGDGAVVLDVDLGAGALRDALDDLAAGPDHRSDLLLIDLQADDLGGVVRDGFARLADGPAHDLEDAQPAFAGLLQRPGEDFRAHPGDLDVHLEPGDALLGARDLEVHVAEVVFLAQDVA